MATAARAVRPSCLASSAGTGASSAGTGQCGHSKGKCLTAWSPQLASHHTVGPQPARWPLVAKDEMPLPPGAPDGSQELAAAPPAGPPRQARPRRRPRWAHTGGKSAGRERDGGYLASLTTSKTGRRWYAPITPKISTSAHVQSPPAPLRAAKTALKMRQMIQDRNSSLAHELVDLTGTRTMTPAMARAVE